MCSVISLKGDKVQAVARTMDFNITAVGDAVRYIKAGDKKLVFKTWVTFNYDVKGVVNVIPDVSILGMQEAINSAGLSFSLLYNIDNSMAKTGGTDNIMIWPIQALAELDTVAKVKKRIEDTKPVFHGPEGQNATCHFFFTDTKGDAIVIEFHEGVPAIYDCPMGVMTNGPEYSWHLTNLRNYLNINPEGVNERKLNGVDYKKIGHGNGFTGVPGGNGSPDRFIRLSLNKAFAKDVTDKNVAAKAANLIGMAHTLYGTQTSPGVDKVAEQDQTLWTTVKYLENGKPMLWIRRIHELNFNEVEMLRDEANA